MAKMLISLSVIYSIFSFLAFIAIIAIAAAHLCAKLKRPKPLRLSSDSIVVIVGACTGIGKLMAIQIAKQYHSTILLIDRRKDLFEEVAK